jgi:hypothetical protein
VKQLPTLILRVALLLLLLMSVLAQLLVPVYASQVGARLPEVAYLVGPYSVAAILFIGCGQLVVLATWRLLSLVDGGVIFTTPALRWVDVIVACGAVATVLTVLVLIHVLAFVPGGGGPLVYYLAGCIAAGFAFVSLMVVMRGLLLAAVADRAELAEVI